MDQTTKTVNDYLEEFKKLAEQIQKFPQANGQCPSCGYCPTCGRRNGFYQQPYTWTSGYIQTVCSCGPNAFCSNCPKPLK